LTKNIVIFIVLEINIDGQTIKELIASAFSQGDANIPASMQNLIFTLVEIIIGLVVYFVLFFVLRFITWILVFPICKIFVKKGQPKRALIGGLIGIIQGFVIAFAFLSPLTGLIVQVDKISNVKIEGEQIINIPEEIGLQKYTNSSLGKIYNSIGDWYFDLLTSGTTEDGTKLSIDDTIDALVTVTNVADSVSTLSNSMETMTNPEATDEERVNAMADTGNKLIEIGNKIDELSDDAKEFINEVLDSVTEMLPDDESSEQIKDILENASIEDLNVASVGEAIVGISSFMDKVVVNNDPESVTQDDVDKIVNGLAGSKLILELIPEETILDVNELGFGDKFANAIEGISDEEAKATLLAMFGIN
jgi:hypothetical protein